MHGAIAAVWLCRFERDCEGLGANRGQRLTHFDPLQRRLTTWIVDVERMHHTTRRVHQRNRMLDEIDPDDGTSDNDLGAESPGWHLAFRRSCHSSIHLIVGNLS